MINKQTLSSKVVIIGLLVLLAFLVDSKYRQWVSEKGVEQQESSLQQQADQLQQKNDELSQSLQYLNSDSFKEGVARQQLGLKKQGEQVYAFADSQQPQQQEQTQSQQSQESNPKKWLDYFFQN